MPTRKDIVALLIIIGGFILGWLLGCDSTTAPPESKFEVGYSDSEEYGLVFWAYVEPKDTIWWEMSCSWARWEGREDSAGVVVIKGVSRLEDIWWKAWTRNNGPDSVRWER
jgi:hypothetical protein